MSRIRVESSYIQHSRHGTAFYPTKVVRMDYLQGSDKVVTPLLLQLDHRGKGIARLNRGGDIAATVTFAQFERRARA